MSIKIKILICCIIAMYMIQSFAQCEYSTTGTVVDFTGLDGCGLVVQISPNEILEPFSVPEGFVLEAGQQIDFDYAINPDGASICMVGPIADILCVQLSNGENCDEEPLWLEDLKVQALAQGCCFTGSIYRYQIGNDVYFMTNPSYDYLNPNFPCPSDIPSTVYDCQGVQICYSGGFIIDEVCAELIPQFEYEELIWTCGQEQECLDVSNVDFGPCDAILGIGWNGNYCYYVSGCSQIGNVDGIDMDYSPYFFETMEVCQINCGSNGGNCTVEEALASQWMQNIILSIEANMSPVECYCHIEQWTWNEVNVFVQPGTNNCSDIPTYVYNCDGEIMCEFGGFIGANTCPDFYSEAEFVTTIYSCPGQSIVANDDEFDSATDGMENLDILDNDIYPCDFVPGQLENIWMLEWYENSDGTIIVADQFYSFEFFDDGTLNVFYPNFSLPVGSYEIVNETITANGIYWEINLYTDNALVGLVSASLNNGKLSITSLTNIINSEFSPYCPINLEIINPPMFGTIEVNWDQTITYVPNGNTPIGLGEDFFTYQICDENDICDTATVTIVFEQPMPECSQEDLQWLYDFMDLTDNAICNVLIAELDGQMVVFSDWTDANGLYQYGVSTCYGEPICGSGVTVADNNCDVWPNFANATILYECQIGCFAPGEYVENPICDEIYEPVCGCNNITYDNECFAHGDGIFEFTEGTCQTANNCDINNMPWLDELIANIEIGNSCYCGVYLIEYQGAPAIFTDSYCNEMDDADVVWDCDGNWICGVNGLLIPENYCNEPIDLDNAEMIYNCNNNTECMNLGGVDFGFCDMPLGIIWNGFDCISISGCDWIVGGVDYTPYFFETFEACFANCGEGACIDETQIDPNYACTEEYNPVCGCDEITYDNPCYAEHYGGVTEYTFGTCASSGSCFLPPILGPCNAYIPSWYYNPLEQTCLEFIYGGCGGNDNRFETMELCMESCSGASGCMDLSSIDFGECEMAMGVVWNGNSCVYLSGCGWEVNGIDYSVFSYETMEACFDGCGGNETECDYENMTWLQDQIFDIINGTSTEFCRIYEIQYAGETHYYLDSDLNYIDVPDVVVNCDGSWECSLNGEIPDEDWCAEPIDLVNAILLYDCEGETCFNQTLVNPNAACITIYDPVCGCNGITYGNSCEAFNNGILMWEMGECNTETGCGNIDTSWIDDLIVQYLNVGPVYPINYLQCVAEYNYNGQTLILFDVDNSFDAMDVYYTCDGTVFCNTNGFGIWDCPEDLYDLEPVNSIYGCNGTGVNCSPANLEWWDEFVSMNCDVGCISQIAQYEYNGETVFATIVSENPCPDWLTQVVNCNYEVVCEFGGIAGLNTCPDFEINAIFQGIVHDCDNQQSQLNANPDYAYGVMNETLTICVLENDYWLPNIMPLVEILYGPEFGTLEWDGNCFIYTPEDNFIGTEGFTYILQLPNGETATAFVSIVIANEVPILDFECIDDYAATAPNQPVAIHVLVNDPAIAGQDVPTVQDNWSLSIIEMPLYGTASLVDEGCEFVSCLYFEYILDDDIEVSADQFVYEYCLNSECDVATVYISLSDECEMGECVWPGDADNDGIANNFDVLSLGLAYGLPTVPRAEVSNQWQAWAADDALSSFNIDVASEALSGQDVSLTLNAKYADCNGDGVVNDDDLLAIGDNYSLTHQKGETHSENDDAPTLSLQFNNDATIPGDLVEAQIVIEAPINAIEPFEIYGVAFTLNYANYYNGISLVVAESVNINFTSSFLSEGSTMIDVTQVFENSSYLESGYSRTNLMNVTGSGAIGTVSFVIEENIAGKININETLTAFVSEAFYIDISGNLHPFNYGQDDIQIISTDIIDLPNISFSVYPNPTSEIIFIHASDIQEYSIRLFDVSGKLVTDNMEFNGSLGTIRVNNVPNGLYFLTIETEEHIETHKIKIMK